MENMINMLIVTFDVFAVNPGIASYNHVFKSTVAITFGRQRATTQPVPLVFRVVVAFHWQFLVLFHGVDI